MCEKNIVGRPMKFTPEDLEDRGIYYFNECEENGDPPTITGLVLALGMYGRGQLFEYEKRPEFSDIIKKFKCLVENSYEKTLRGHSPTGSIFALKAMGWKETQSHEISGPDGGPLEIGLIKRIIVDEKTSTDD